MAANFLPFVVLALLANRAAAFLLHPPSLYRAGRHHRPLPRQGEFPMGRQWLRRVGRNAFVRLLARPFRQAALTTWRARGRSG
jgi:hypothetical protein